MKKQNSVALIVVLAILEGCAASEPFRFGPDPYSLECADGEVWTVSEHGRSKLGAACSEENVEQK